MPPTLTFVRLDRKRAVPTRIHVNRKRLLSSKLFYSAIESSARTKALLTLKKINHIRISNRDITSLTQSIKDDILKVLVETPINELIKRSSSAEIPIPPQSICIDLKKSAWKCHVVVPIIFLFRLRSYLRIPTHVDDLPIFQKVKSSVNISTINLLTKETVFEPTILIEEEEEDDAFTIKEKEADTKKGNIQYKFKKPYVLNDLGGFLDIYIYERPSRNEQASSQ